MGAAQDLQVVPSRNFGLPFQPQTFRRDGEIWTIASAGVQIHLRDLRGLHHLATLLRDPGRDYHVCELVRAGTQGADAVPLDASLTVVRGIGSGGACIDAQARVAYLARLRALEAEHSDAERRNDLARLELVSAEREALLAELEASARRWREGSHAERARVAVTKAIKTALDRISAWHSDLGAHLSATIRRGYFCSYRPDPRAQVDWET